MVIDAKEELKDRSAFSYFYFRDLPSYRVFIFSRFSTVNAASIMVLPVCFMVVEAFRGFEVKDSLVLLGIPLHMIVLAQVIQCVLLYIPGEFFGKYSLRDQLLYRLEFQNKKTPLDKRVDLNVKIQADINNTLIRDKYSVEVVQGQHLLVAVTCLTFSPLYPTLILMASLFLATAYPLQLWLISKCHFGEMEAMH